MITFRYLLLLVLMLALILDGFCFQLSLRRTMKFSSLKYVGNASDRKDTRGLSGNIVINAFATASDEISGKSEVLRYPSPQSFKPPLIILSVHQYLEDSKRKFSRFLLQIVSVICMTFWPLATKAAVAVKSNKKSVAIKNSGKKLNSKKLMENVLNPKLKLPSQTTKIGESLEGFQIISNLLPIGFMVVVAAVVGTVLYQVDMQKQMSRMKSELLREKEYKENMYFDAVEKIAKLLENPKLRFDKKLKLEAELKSLDPNGKIRNFIKNGGERPDLSIRNTDSSKDSTRKQSRRPENVRESSPSTVSSASNKNLLQEREDRMTKVLSQLDKTLMNGFTTAERKMIVEDLKTKFTEWMKIPDDFEAKLSKVSQSINDSDFWKRYLKRLQKKK